MRKDDGHPLSDELVKAVRACVGIRFRPQGRDRTGLDCLGLIVRAANDAGVFLAGPLLPLRGIQLDEAEQALAKAGFRTIPRACPGDVLLTSPANRQVHLAMFACGTLVEAHAGLGRVVERPLAASDSAGQVWRLPLGEG